MGIYTAIYRLAISAYFAVVRIAGIFNPKAALFIKGRKGLPLRIRAALEGDSRPRIWMHCASLGEFEQGRPVLETLREKYPQFAIVLTFFSPSGYEVRKNYEGADYVFYLPMDTHVNANTFLDTVSPSLCIFVKYEFWYFYLTGLASRYIPVILISAVFKPRQGFFKWYGGLHREMLHCFTHIFVQDKASMLLLKKIKVTEVSVSGDTRFDRVIKAIQTPEELPVPQGFSEGHKILIAGSTWKEDEIFLHRALKSLPERWKLILVPHEVSSSRIADIEKRFAGNTVKWSTWAGGMGKRVLIVDQVGFLSQLYRYGQIAWIGGGFGKEGVHNILEAAVYGIPCFYGPVYHQFLEAAELIEKGGGFTTKLPSDFVASVLELEDSYRYEQHSTAAKNYVLSGGGATTCVVKYIEAILVN